MLLVWAASSAYRVRCSELCGIAGWAFVRPLHSLTTTTDVSRRLVGALGHRGPDDSGTWRSEDLDFALVHTRLAIQDIAGGAQPMQSRSGRFVVSYNGELYNSRELSKRLLGRGVDIGIRSDTALLIEHIAEFGFKETLRILEGMFAFAVVDLDTRSLALARDQIGVKPLYWARTGGGIAFASEMVAMEQIPGVDKDVNLDAVSSLLRHNYIPAPLSIYGGVHKLEPGTALVVSGDGSVESERYWDLWQLAATASTPVRSRLEVMGEVQHSIERSMVADVPVGTLLSGGIDSSLVTAVASHFTSEKIQSFSIGFEDPTLDESSFARAVADVIGTDHHELVVTDQDALQVVAQLPTLYSEPFADSSQIPTVLVSRLARGSVKVVLSGDGGDEVFAGYQRYFAHRAAQTALRRFGPRLGGLTASAARSLGPRLPQGSAVLQRKVRRLAALLENSSSTRSHLAYRNLVSHWLFDPDVFEAVGDYRAPAWDEASAYVEQLDDVSLVQVLDTLTYLPDDILTKVDRASMSVGLEVRVPLLNRRLVEAAWSLPRSAHSGGYDGKLILKELLATYVPAALTDRPKMGFGVPLDRWLRGPLRDWAGDLLTAPTRRTAGYIPQDSLDVAWKRQQGGGAFAYPLWNVLMLEAWLQHR